MTAAILSPRARRELLAVVRWIAKDDTAAAEALLEAVDKAAQLIGQHPDFGRFRPELAGPTYRFVALTGFPYIIVYNADREPPMIVHIVHGARDLPELLKKL